MILSEAGLRLAKHATGSPSGFPKFSGDPVIQFLVEEALLARLEIDKLEASAPDPDDPSAHQQSVLAKLERVTGGVR